MFLILTLLFIVWLVYVINKFILQPKKRMKRYGQYKGLTLMPFIPVVGAFKIADESYKKHNDELYDSKILLQTNPECRGLVFNAMNKCFLSLTDPTLIQEFFHKQENYVKQESFLLNRTRLIGKGVAFSQGQAWSKQRKILSSLFHFSYFNNFIKVIQDVTDNKISEIMKSDRSFEAQQLTQFISGDTIVKTFFGISFNQKIDDKHMANWIGVLLRDNVAQQRSLRYFLFGLPILKLGLFEIDRSVNQRIKKYKAIATHAIESRLASKDVKETMLEIIKEQGILGKNGEYDMDRLVQEFMGFFVAGVDTTSQLLVMSFYYLSQYPQWQEILRKEIKQSRILDNLEYKQISQLKQMEIFIKEVFRHSNYVVSIFPRRCIKSHTIGDIFIQQGDLVMPGWSNINYNPKIYPEPFKFYPERWQKLDKLNPYTFTPFSIGARGCLGQHFALMVSKIVLIKFINKFDMKLKQGYEMKLKTTSLYGPINPMTIEVQEVK